MTDHKSDCAVHNEPAMPAGPCDCGAGIVEAMARAICRTDANACSSSFPCKDRCRWASRGEFEECDHIQAARAALTAALDCMREPSEGMLAACNGADRLSTAAMVDADNHATWQAMLNQSAKEAFDD